MLRHLDAYLSATQLGITLASIALGWVGEPAFAWILRPLVHSIPGATPELEHSIALTTAFVFISILHIVFGELVPKSVAIRLPAATSLAISFPLYLFYWLAFPAIWLLNKTANSILRLVGIQPASEHELAHSEEEVRLLLASRHGSDLSQQKRDLLENVFELYDRIARQVMVPRGDVVYLSTDRSLEQNLAVARESGHTRFPLCEGRDLDRVVGVVHIKDLFRAGAAVPPLERIARPIKFVPESIALDKLLARMRSERLHLAAVLDEYGGVAGIVTLENVIEEIVGEIQDEFDAERPELVARGEGVFTVSGAMLLVDLEHELGLELSPRDEDTASPAGGSRSAGPRRARGARSPGQPDPQPAADPPLVAALCAPFDRLLNSIFWTRHQGDGSDSRRLLPRPSRGPMPIQQLIEIEGITIKAPKGPRSLRLARTSP